MPCSTNGEYDSYEMGQESMQEDVDREVEKNKKLHALLCYACMLLKENGVSIGAELESWSKDHDKEDYERIQEEDREEYYASVMNRLKRQLTSTEKRAISISKAIWHDYEKSKEKSVKTITSELLAKIDDNYYNYNW